MMKNIKQIKEFIKEAQKRRTIGERITADYIISLAFIVRGASTRSDLMGAMKQTSTGLNDYTIEQLIRDRMIVCTIEPRPVTHQFQKVFKPTKNTYKYEFLSDSEFLFELETIKKLFYKAGHKVMLRG